MFIAVWNLLMKTFLDKIGLRHCLILFQKIASFVGANQSSVRKLELVSAYGVPVATADFENLKRATSIFIFLGFIYHLSPWRQKWWPCKFWSIIFDKIFECSIDKSMWFKTRSSIKLALASVKRNLKWFFCANFYIITVIDQKPKR